MHNIIFSTCGTSIITHGLDKEQTQLILAHSNCDEEMIRRTSRWNDIQCIIRCAENKFLHASNNEAVNMSAEWNCLFNYMQKKNTSFSEWTHYLIPTDTYFGKEIAKILHTRLQNHQADSIILEQRYLQTADAYKFKEGVTELTAQIEEMVHSTNYKQIVFNLTGGFKALNAYLQSLATLFAATSIYLFERSTEIIEIPSLPLKIDLDVFTQNIDLFQKLEMQLELSPTEITHIQSALILNCDGIIDWSVWGQALWRKSKQQIYQKMLHIPSDIIAPRDLRQQWENESLDHRFRINEALFYLAQYNRLQKEPRQGYQIKPIKGKQAFTHEMYVWSDGKGYRFFWTKNNEGQIVIQSLGIGLGH